MRFWLLAALTAAVAATSTAQANSARITRGDAQALFQALFNGGSAIRVHRGDVLEGAPVQSGGRIPPLPFFNGRHVCSLSNSREEARSGRECVIDQQHATILYVGNGAIAALIWLAVVELKAGSFKKTHVHRPVGTGHAQSVLERV